MNLIDRQDLTMQEEKVFWRLWHTPRGEWPERLKQFWYDCRTRCPVINLDMGAAIIATWIRMTFDG